MIEPQELDQFFSRQHQRTYVDLCIGRVGLTRRRAECFVRLWAYLILKDQLIAQTNPPTKPAPITQLDGPQGWMTCTCREAADLFYADRERGSDRSAGMMLDKLAALGLIKKQFDGNNTQIAIQPLPELAPTRDTTPNANLLATNYNWMNRNTTAVPFRIANLLRDWASQYATGMRVLRRCDNLNPVGFYLFYPTHPNSEVNFFATASKGLHLSAVSEVDPFTMAQPGDHNCRAIFIRSWMIEAPYRPQAMVPFLKDAQAVLGQMKQDFPNLCDLHTLMIHPMYADLTQALGFQKTSPDPKVSVYWMYLALDRFLALDIDRVISSINQSVQT
jgi:hypothetical protein